MNHMDSSGMVEPIMLDLEDNANASDAVELVSMFKVKFVGPAEPTPFSKASARCLFVCRR